jgi:hypothetical protein
MINLKPLIWEQGEEIIHSFPPQTILVCINPLAEFAIWTIFNPDETPEHQFRLEICYAHGQWDCFTYPTIEQCKERADAWLRDMIEEAIIFEVPALKKKKQPKINYLTVISECFLYYLINKTPKQ